jgi:hypothetical protein
MVLVFVLDMPGRSLWISALVLVLTACDRSVHCPPIDGATRVVIEVWSSAGTPRDVQVTDSERIRHLMDFANERRNCSTPTTYTMPAPRTNVTFYRSSTAEGSIGAGANFFLVGCGNLRGLRHATEEELSAFGALTSVPH